MNPSPITGTVTTTLKLQEPKKGGGWQDIPGQTYTRTATEQQTVSGNADKSITYTSEAVVDGLEDSTGQSGALQGSNVSGGMGIERGTMSARTAWAGTSGGFNVEFTVGISPASVKVTIAGTTVASTMDWSKPGLEWSFKVMTKEELDAWLEANP